MLGAWRARRDQGDTLIEVLFAVTVFALIVVTTLSIMNQGTATSQRSVEITTVRQQMDAQTEMLRFLHDSYVQSFSSGVAADPATNAGQYARALQIGKDTTAVSALGSTSCGTPPAGAFVLRTTGSGASSRVMLVNRASQSSVFTAPTTYAQAGIVSGAFRAQGLWVEALANNSVSTTTSGFTDFHVRACWSAPGLKQPMNLGTIVRLYEPR